MRVSVKKTAVRGARSVGVKPRGTYIAGSLPNDSLRETNGAAGTKGLHRVQLKRLQSEKEGKIYTRAIRDMRIYEREMRERREKREKREMREKRDKKERRER